MEFLEKFLSPSRVAHSLRVAREAEHFAKIYGEDAHRAYIAGLLHDCARDLPVETLLELLPPYLQQEVIIPEVLHALVGPELLERELGFRDFRILRAIRWHATGCEQMTTFDKVIFVADIAEPGREFCEAESIRKVALKDLQEGYVLALRAKMKYLLATCGVIHPESLRSWNKEVQLLTKGRSFS
ncbi:bis(5'-nucleosyl)-tetraphosphatase (symmetrical) YqeK [Candidatus Caldatribacterium sp.]|uniref:bis(5'-nucleosyl)-tetraphosphatase (symmetrical) YqeK n=1 Tax=Candidatus Caldatribacterium sp. TaxID=2282143 RepID=UPI003872DD1D